MHYAFQFGSAVKVQGNSATTLVVFLFFKLQYTVSERWKTLWLCVAFAVRVASDSSDCDWPGLKEIDLAA